MLYILNYIDRNNVSAARTHGFEEDLKLEGNQIDTVLSILYGGCSCASDLSQSKQF